MKGALTLVLVASFVGCAAHNTPTYMPAPLTPAGTVSDRIGPAMQVRSASPEEPGKPLDLEDCVRTALANHRNIGIADRRVLIAKDRLTEAWGAILPKVAAEGRYEGRNNDRGSSFGGNTFVTGERRTGTAKLSLVAPIYDFGGAWNQRNAMRLRVEVAELNSATARQDLTLAVSQTYFRVLEAQKIQQVIAESIQTLEQQLQVAQDFFGQGLVAKNEVLAVEVQLAERRQDQIQAENNVQLAVATLNRLMGVDVVRPTQIADVLEVKPWEGSFESALQVAVEKRPDLSALRQQIEIARAEFRATRAGFLPRIYAFGDYNRSTDDFLLNSDWLSGGVAVQFPLFDGGFTYAQVQRKKREVAEMVDLRDEHVDDAVLGVKSAYLGVREAAGRIPVARKGVEYAEENLRIIRDQYSQGLVSSADVLVEEDRLTRARSSFFSALYNYHEAFAQLVKETGGTPIEK